MENHIIREGVGSSVSLDESVDFRSQEKVWKMNVSASGSMELEEAREYLKLIQEAVDVLSNK